MAKILLVEDHAMSRQVLYTLLGYTGHDVLEAADGMAAIEIAHREHPDLIITDILMPTMDGMEFVRQLRTERDFVDTPVIFYTASYRRPESLRLDESYGTYRVILKPSDPQLILKTVNELLKISPEGDNLKHIANKSSKVFHKSAFPQGLGLQLPVLMELSYSLVAQRNSKELLSTFSRTIRQLLNCKQSLLAIQDDNGIMQYFLGDAENKPTDSFMADLLPPAEILERVVVGRSPVRWQKMHSLAPGLSYDCPLLFESLLVAPFASPNYGYGWICLINKLDASLFSDGDEEIAITLSTQAALAYENILMVEQLRKSDEVKSMFMANISHELRTPLNILVSSAHLLNSYLQDDDVLDRSKLSKKINMQLQNCNRLLRLINNFIDITKIDSGYFDINPTNCNIVEIVEAITMSVVEYARIKGIDLVFDTEEEEILLVCDLDSIERIILNLLSNAIKFTTEGGTIYVNLSKHKGYVYISVKDTGIGISKDKFDIIFERFRQVDNLMTRKNEGSGIGLSLVKLLTEMQGGRIHVSSEYQKGSEFRVELPINMAIKDDVAPGNRINYYKEDVVKRIQVEFSDIYW